MRRILILAATVTLAATAARAQDMPQLFSEKGPNFPTSQHGPAYPSTASEQESGPSFGGTAAPAQEQRSIPQNATPDRPDYNYGSGPEQRAEPIR
jgi:hypothetical protein